MTDSLSRRHCRRRHRCCVHPHNVHIYLKVHTNDTDHIFIGEKEKRRVSEYNSVYTFFIFV